MGTAADIEAAEAILKLERAALIVMYVVAPIIGADVGRIKRGLPSFSVAGGVVWRRYPKTCWAVWIGLGLHIWLEWDDPLNWLGRQIKGAN